MDETTEHNWKWKINEVASGLVIYCDIGINLIQRSLGIMEKTCIKVLRLNASLFIPCRFIVAVARTEGQSPEFVGIMRYK
jgi:hypothetical protein